MIKFTSKASASVSMFDNDAERLIKMTGHSGSIPCAIRGKDVNQYLATFEAALISATEKELPLTYEEEEDNEPPPISLNRRAFPLLELMRAAAKAEEDVMWDYEHPII